MKLRRKNWRLTSWVVLFTFITTLLYQSGAEAFKIKTHVYTANISMVDAMDGDIYLQGFREFPGHTGVFLLNNPKFVEAIQKYPGVVRAGALGPDGFPDLIWGQQSPHVNHGKFADGAPSPMRRLFGKERNLAKNISSDVPFFSGRQRDLEDPFTWRSIDHAMFILAKALNYHVTAEEGTRQHELHLQAIAFAYGYLVHVAGDAFVHTFVNRVSGGFFDLFAGEGLFGSATEEIKHIAIEGFIDHKFTEAVFRDRKYILNPPNMRDNKMLGNNGVVAPVDGFQVTNECVETGQKRSWFYCNPLPAVPGNPNTGQDCSPQNLRDQNPWENCKPWEEICRPENYADDLKRFRDELAECHEKSEPGSRGIAAMQGEPSGMGSFWRNRSDAEKDRWLKNLADDLIIRKGGALNLLGEGKDFCGIAYVGPLLTELPQTCDPNIISQRENRRGEMEILNECIQINCMYDSSKCPTPAIKGWEDRGMRPETACTPSVNFGSLGTIPEGADTVFQYPQALQDFLKSVEIHIPLDFLTRIYVEDPDDPTVELRNLGGPHIKFLQFIRNLLRSVSQNKWIKLLTLNPIDFIRAAGSLIRSTNIPILSDAIGWPIEKIGGLLSTAADFIGEVVCRVTFGLFCPQPRIPIINLSLFLEERAQIVQEQLHRWEDLSFCIGQNLLNAANLPPGQELTKNDDACRSLPWWMESWDQYRENVQGLIDSGLDAVGIPVERDDYNPGSVVNALDKIQAFFLDQTFGEVLSLHQSDFGAEGWLADAAWFVLEVLFFDILLLPFKLFLDFVKKEIREALFNHFVPNAVKVHLQNEGASPETIINIAFLKDDVRQDQRYFTLLRTAVSGVTGGAAAAGLLDRVRGGGGVNDAELAALVAAVRIAMSRAEQSGRALVGVKLKELKGLMQLRSVEDRLTVNRFYPLFNAIQLNKLAWMGKMGVSSLTLEAESLEDALLRDLLPGAFGIQDPILLIGEKACELLTNGNLMCEGVPSLDDPDNYGHVELVASLVGVGSPSQIAASVRPRFNPDRSVAIDRVIQEREKRPGTFTKVYDLTSFIPLQSAGNVSHVYAQTFSPFHCNNNPHDDVDADRDSIQDDCDNCLNFFNPGQEDLNTDGIGDNCPLAYLPNLKKPLKGLMIPPRGIKTVPGIFPQKQPGFPPQFIPPVQPPKPPRRWGR